MREGPRLTHAYTGLNELSFKKKKLNSNDVGGEGDSYR